MVKNKQTGQKQGHKARPRETGTTLKKAAGTGTSDDPEASARYQDSNISKDSSLSETGPKETTSSKAEPEPESPAEPGTASAEGSASPGSEASTSREDKPLPLLVGIGASAGGLDAMNEFLDHLNGGDCLTLFIVQHQASQSDKQTLSNLLGKHTRHKVCLARDGETYHSGRIYVTPPDKELSLYDGRIQLTERERGARSMIIDAFFRSLALEGPGRAVAVILSGSNTDGTLGARAVKERNGLVIAQDPESAGFPTMPQSIVDEGLADVILKPSEMVEHILGFAENLRLVPPEAKTPEALVPTNERDKLFMLLKKRTGHDFSKYKDNTVNRRIQRRMAVHRIDRLKDYVSYIRRNQDEADHLFRDLLIGVTNFFRDSTVFEGLKELLLKEYLPRLSNSQFRAWVPGCATGEEAYSLAIILTEALDELEANIKVVIYGTDLDEAAIDQARKGIFPKNIEADVSSERMKRFFGEEEIEGRYRIKQEIREMLVFAVHNVTSDPPFSRLNLVCCRNLLMYLKPEAQKSVLSQFRYGLVDDGLLLLGTSESITVLAQPFETVDKKLRLYRIKPGAAGVLFPEDQLFRHRTPQHRRKGERRRQDAAEPEAGNIRRAAERFLLEMSEPSVLVNKTGDILYFHGRSGRYLEPVKGRPQSNILEMARKGLCMDLSAALTMAAAKKEAQVRTGVKIRSNDHEETVDLFVRPLDLEDRKEPCFMISFQKSPERKPPAHGNDIQNHSNRARTRIKGLQEELQNCREDMQSMAEKYEAANEELKSSNEELQSTNEELKSTNEELETAKEELQSINEEQTTLNSELQAKNKELESINDDMMNLMAATRIATLFLDNDLQIRRFTPAMKDIISLRESDEGRPVREMSIKLEYDSLEQDAEQVLADLNSVEREVHGKEGNWYQLRLMPYRTRDNVINGVVITLNNITHLKESERQAHEAQRFAESVINTVQEPLLILDQDLRVETTNQAFLKTFRTKRDQTEGRSLYNLGNGQWNIPELKELLEEVIPEKIKIVDYVVQHEFPSTGLKRIYLNALAVPMEEGGSRRILLVVTRVEDIDHQPL